MQMLLSWMHCCLLSVTSNSSPMPRYHNAEEVRSHLQALSSAAAERAHEAMLAAGVRGHARLYNTLVKTFAYEAEAGASGLYGRHGIADASGSGSSAASGSTWNLQKVWSANRDRSSPPCPSLCMSVSHSPCNGLHCQPAR